jgi:predicted nucleic acid-binding protein
MEMKHSHVVLDACCVLNFCASGHLIEIVRSIPAQGVVTEVVRERELLTLQRLTENNREDVDQFEAAIKEGLLAVVDFGSEGEEETFVNSVFALGDDGEAATCAIAVGRGWAIATDDRKAISFFQKEAPHLQILSTLEIVKHWSETGDVSADTLLSALTAIRTKGRYVPRRNHPLLHWWEISMQGNGT